MWVRVPPGLFVDIEYWDNGNRGGMGGMVREWQKLDTGSLKIKMAVPEWDYIKHLWTLTKSPHRFVRGLRTIVKVNGKYLFLDSTDRSRLAAESWKLPFDLILKFQYCPDRSYRKIKSKVVPFTYTMSYYDMALVQRCWEKRQEVLRTRKFTSSMFWAGKLNTNRKQRDVVMAYLRAMKHSTYKKRAYKKYFSELATTQAGIAAAGTGDFTHRDIELMSVGSAFFRKTFENSTRNPRIPNVHYYSIGGHEVGIGKTMKHFCRYFEPERQYRVFSDEEWDKYREISYNARKWWEENGSPQGTFNLFREILEENNIV